MIRGDFVPLAPDWSEIGLLNSWLALSFAVGPPTAIQEWADAQLVPCHTHPLSFTSFYVRLLSSFLITKEMCAQGQRKPLRMEKKM